MIIFNNNENIFLIYILIALLIILFFKFSKKIIIFFKTFFKKDKKSKNITLKEIDKMDGLKFEKFLFELFKNKGENVKVTKGSNDQGADLVIKKNKMSFLKKSEIKKDTVIQAKRYKNKVTNTAIQEVVAAKAFYKCNHALVITNNLYTKSALQLAEVNKVELWDRYKLKQEIEKYPVPRNFK